MVRLSVDAYIVRRIQYGASIQEQLNHLQMTVASGPDQGSPTILRETDEERKTMKYYYQH